MLKVLFPWKQNNTKKVLCAMEQVVTEGMFWIIPLDYSRQIYRQKIDYFSLIQSYQTWIELKYQFCLHIDYWNYSYVCLLTFFQDDFIFLIQIELFFYGNSKKILLLNTAYLIPINFLFGNLFTLIWICLTHNLTTKFVHVFEFWYIILFKLSCCYYSYSDWYLFDKINFV